MGWKTRGSSLSKIIVQVKIEAIYNNILITSTAPVQDFKLNVLSSPDDEDEEELLRRAIAMSLEGTEEEALVSLNGEEDLLSH